MGGVGGACVFILFYFLKTVLVPDGRPSYCSSLFSLYLFLVLLCALKT